MKIKRRHLVKFWKMLTDTSAFVMVKEYQIKGDKPLNGLLTYLDTLWCKLRYGMTTKEYFLFGFYNKSGYARRSFVSSAESSWTIENLINRGDKSLFNQKYKTYEAFKPFFRREAISLNLPNDRSRLEEFAYKHGAFILKPMVSSQGRGICFWNKDMEQADSLLKQMGQSQWGGGNS